MAARVPELLWYEGRAERTALYRVLEVTAADTIDVAAEFARVKVATALSVTRSEVLDAPAIVGTVLTLDEVGMALDAVLVLVHGSAK